MSTDLSDFDRWLISGGIDPADIGDNFPQLWASYEAWTRGMGEPEGGQICTPTSETVLVLADERWPARAIRTEVVL